MTRSPDREQFLADIITTAVEGGIGYWSQVSAYKWTDGPKLTRAVVHPLNEADDGYVAEGLELTIDHVASGIARIMFADGVNVGATMRQAIRMADRANDAGDLDADACDLIVQAALLGSIVYG